MAEEYGQQGVAAADGLDHEQRGGGDRQQHAEPGPRRRAAHGQQDEAEDRDAEEAEQRTARVAVLHERVQQHAGQLGGEQDRGGLPPGDCEHGVTLALASVGDPG